MSIQRFFIGAILTTLPLSVVIAAPYKLLQPIATTLNTTVINESRFSHNARINDPDGYTNVRSGASGKSKVIARVYDGEEFETYPQNGAWWQVKTKSGIEGYMHQSRIQLGNKIQNSSSQSTKKSQLTHLFNSEMIGVNYAYFESIAGVPRNSFGNTHTFEVASCQVDATVNNGQVSSLRLELSPQCNVDLGTLFHNYDFPATSAITPSLLANASHRSTLDYLSDCLSSCGNAYDPSVYAHWSGSRADDFLEVLLEIKAVNDEAIAARRAWASYIYDRRDWDYVIETRFNCNLEFNDFAHSVFQSLPVNAITIGHDLTEPITSYSCQ